MDREDVLLARQPIYNVKQEIEAYELLFRPENGEPISSFSGTEATSRVLLSAFADNDIQVITGGVPAFVNFTEELLHSPPPFGPEHLVIEVLEDIKVTDEVVAALAKLKKSGYRIALDDYIKSAEFEPLLKLVDIVKLEIPEIPDDELEATVNYLKPFNVKLLAEKIEDHETFAKCKAVGCELFQGYFLSKPMVVTGKKMPQNKVAVLQLLSEVQNPTIALSQLVDVIKKDATLSFKLLQLVNSAAFRRSREIESINMAVMMLGLMKIKSWASLLALSSMEDKPASLKLIALQRSKFCELFAEKIEPDFQELYFTTGLLSCLDAFFDQPLKTLVQNLPLDKKIKDALLYFNGKTGLALHTAINYEQSHWRGIHWKILEKLKLGRKEVNAIYLESIEWATQHKDQ